MEFSSVIQTFVDACPGPPLAKSGLMIAALQPVKGIPGLEPRPGLDGRDGGAGEYICTVKAVAKRMHARPGYLTEVALSHGYEYSRALRWIRYLHAVALRAEGCKLDEVVWRLGFGDAAGWSHFVTRLLGRSPRLLPVLPLEDWVRMAVNDVFLGIPATGPRAENAPAETTTKAMK